VDAFTLGQQLGEVGMVHPRIFTARQRDDGLNHRRSVAVGGASPPVPVDDAPYALFSVCREQAACLPLAHPKEGCRLSYTEHPCLHPLEHLPSSFVSWSHLQSAFQRRT
jgi:hypothetical protein